MSRLNYLDNLKVVLTFLVIFHHAGQAYGDGGEWGYTPSNPAEVMPWIWHFFSTNAAFFMGLYFFISGYFVPGSYDRQGFSTFVRKKILRLGVPLLLMGGLLTYATGKVELAHMWFVESLLIFSFFYAVVRKRCPGNIKRLRLTTDADRIVYCFISDGHRQLFHSSGESTRQLDWS